MLFVKLITFESHNTYTVQEQTGNVIRNIQYVKINCFNLKREKDSDLKHIDVATAFNLK